MLRVDIGSWGPKKVPEHEGWEESLGFDREVLVHLLLDLHSVPWTLHPRLLGVPTLCLLDCSWDSLESLAGDEVKAEEAGFSSTV